MVIMVSWELIQEAYEDPRLKIGDTIHEETKDLSHFEMNISEYSI